MEFELNKPTTKKVKTNFQFTKEVFKEKVKDILEGLESIEVYKISDDKGLLDYNKLIKIEQVKNAIYRLNELGVTTAYLREYFFIAWVCLGRFMKK